MWAVNPDILVTDLQDELVLMHPQSSQMFSLNATGRLLWLALPASQTSLTELLAREYGLETLQAKQDVQNVLNDLMQRDLVRSA